MTTLNRRSFITASAASLPALGTLSACAATATAPFARAPRNGPVAISSGNGIPAVTRAYELMMAGRDPVEAVVEGVTIVEDDPNDNSVGYGGLPNEHGVVELDASVMHGPSHKAGAVASLQNIKNPAKLALEVLRRTNHALLVGEGAREFARQMGFQEENLLTERSRQAWLRWKANLNPGDDWLDNDQQVRFEEFQSSLDEVSPDAIPFTWGTIHCGAVNAAGDLSACTTTSGLSWKIAGRVGDSPIIGAGMFVDNEVGAAGSTGRGESVIKSCGAFQVVNNMERGDDPNEACLKVLRWIAAHTKRDRLLNQRGEPNFNVIMYAVRKDGAYGSACMRRGRTFAVCDAQGARQERCAYVYE